MTVIKFVFKSQNSILREEKYTANQAPERREFIKAIYTNLTEKIDKATENLIDDDLSEPAKEVFNKMIKLLEIKSDDDHKFNIIVTKVE